MRPAATECKGRYRTFPLCREFANAESHGVPECRSPAAAPLLRGAARDKEERRISPDRAAL